MFNIELGWIANRWVLDCVDVEQWHLQCNQLLGGIYVYRLWLAH